MKFYQSKYSLLAGTSFEELAKTARTVYREAVGKSRRTPYVNSKCKLFETQKVFLDLYWAHLNQKPARERFRRVKFYQCALDTLRNSQTKPEITMAKDKRSIFYRFYGVTRSGEKFCVQVKEERKTGHKYFMSVFPWDKHD
jgi:hypothetical protein